MYWVKSLFSERPASGLEWQILRRLPMVLLGGLLVPLLVSQASRLFPPELPPDLLYAHLTRIDITMIALALTTWLTVFTVAIGCLMVVMMKGPPRTADPYTLTDFKRPCPASGRLDTKRS